MSISYQDARIERVATTTVTEAQPAEVDTRGPRPITSR
jgi:hypothetical protein